MILAGLVGDGCDGVELGAVSVACWTLVSEDVIFFYVGCPRI